MKPFGRYGDCLEVMMVRGQWANLIRMQVTLLFFSKDILGLLITTESQNLGSTFNPKDGAW